MKPKKRQKLCHHCEGEVDLDVIVCPFCAADLREEKPEQPRFSSSVAATRLSTEQSLYPSSFPEEVSEPTPRINIAEETMVQTEKPQAAVSMPSPIVGVLLFAIGAQLFFLGIAFLLFSDRGVLLLQFNANWWPLCLLFAIPLLIFGYRASKLL